MSISNCNEHICGVSEGNFPIGQGRTISPLTSDWGSGCFRYKSNCCTAYDVHKSRFANIKHLYTLNCCSRCFACLRVSSPSLWETEMEVYLARTATAADTAAAALLLTWEATFEDEMEGAETSVGNPSNVFSRGIFLVQKLSSKTKRKNRESEKDKTNTLYAGNFTCIILSLIILMVFTVMVLIYLESLFFNGGKKNPVTLVC